MSNKKIIFINRFFYPDQSATSQILTDLLVNIEADIDAYFHVISSRNTYQNDAKLSPHDKLNDININRVWTTRFGRSNLIGRAFDYLSFYISTFFWLLMHVKRGDVVITKTDPPVISFVSYLITKLKGAVLVNWLQDLFPEVAGELGVINKNSILYCFLKRLKNISLSAANMNIVIGEKMAALVEEQGVDSSHIDVIRNWSVSEKVEYVEKDKNHLISEWGLKDKFVIAYSGNFGRAHEYEPIKKLVTDLQDDDVVFLFIGGGKYYDDLKDYAQASDLPNIVFKPYQDKKVLNYSLSTADLHLISLIPSLEGLIVPSKFYGIASIGVPMLFIGDENGEVGKVIKDKQCGYILSPNDYDNGVSKVREIKAAKTDRNKISSNLLALYKEEYKPEVAYIKWRSILNEFLV